MKIGLLAYSTNTGLGYQTQDFAKHMEPAKVLIVDLKIHNRMPTDHDRFDYLIPINCKKKIAVNWPSNEMMEWLVDEMDIVFICETPLNFHLLEYAKSKGVPVVNQYNYEFLDYHRNMYLPMPTVLASPTTWGIEKVKRMHPNVVHWPVPIDTEKIQFREINSVKTFTHIIGRPAAYDRNGTELFLKAVEAMGNKYEYKVYLQTPVEMRSIDNFKPLSKLLDQAMRSNRYNLKVIENCPNNELMYKDGEVLVLPRRYGGLCLPMWEALSAGMPVIMPRISPNDSILPKEWLVDADKVGGFKTTTEIDLFDVHIDYPPATNHLISVMENVAYNIKENNLKARKIAENMSWNVQKPIYIQKLKALCKL